MPVASFLLVMLLAALQARPDFRADVKVVRVDTGSAQMPGLWTA
jgi:hypothetical protein